MRFYFVLLIFANIVCWSFHGSVGRCSAAGLIRWQVPQSGMHYRTVLEIQSWL